MMTVQVRVAALALAALVLVALIASSARLQAWLTTRQLPVAEVAVDTSLGPKAFFVEVAADSASRARGLMARSWLAPDGGMLFDFRRNVRVAFWMKNTSLPLDMLFIRSNGMISSIRTNAVPYSTKSIPSVEPVRAVLEINGGTASKLGIKVGDHVRATILHDAK